MHPQMKTVVRALISTIASLLAVGIVSHTPLRHLIQVSPAVAVLTATLLRAPWAAFAALPIFLFWLLIMVAIWLFLLGLARIVNGTFSPAEIGLTLAIGVSCLWGMFAALRAPRSPGSLPRVIAAVVFAALQVGAMWLSLSPDYARR
jgi:hypothetical protein